MHDEITPQDIGMRVPRHIIDGEEVYGWMEEKVNEPHRIGDERRVNDVPPPVQEHRQTEESSPSLMQRTASVLKRCVVS
eukprot:57082-Eustigmatos_ZCMA.PRE.1